MAISGRHSPRSKTDEWLTPPEILAALGPFDLDPCAPWERPWPMAKRHYCELGLLQPWEGRIWLNPPYGKETGWWLRRLADHGNGIALIFARTDTSFFFSEIWQRADALLFLEGRLCFYRADGTRISTNSGGPSVLIAYGHENAERLKTSGLRGAYCSGWIMVGQRG